MRALLIIQIRCRNSRLHTNFWYQPNQAQLALVAVVSIEIMNYVIPFGIRLFPLPYPANRDRKDLIPHSCTEPSLSVTLLLKKIGSNMTKESKRCMYMRR